MLLQFLIIIFRVCHQNKSVVSKVKFRQASNRCKSVLELAKLANVLSLFRNLVLITFGKLQMQFWTKANLLYPQFNSGEVLPCGSDKESFFLKSFPEAVAQVLPCGSDKESFFLKSFPEAVAQRCSVKKIFLEISQI